MLLDQLLTNIKYKSDNFQNIDISMIVYDSKRAVENSIFVCLVGARTDGHIYANKAYDAGSRAFLCERKLDLPNDAVQIIVDNTRKNLALISAEFFGRPADSLNIIGITGTKGKTTTALMSLEILNQAGFSTAYIGSNGVIINGKLTKTVNTTPESYDLHYFFRKMVVAGIKNVVLEVSSQALKHYRVYGIKFYAAVFMNLSRDHISPVEHPDFDDYMNSKAKLFTDQYLAGKVIFNADDQYNARVTGAAHKNALSFAVDNDADFIADDIESYRDEHSLGVKFTCCSKDNDDRYEKCDFKMIVPGQFNVYNALASVAICSLFGIKASFCADVLSRTTVSGRFELVKGLKNRTFIIDYAHNEVSLTNALKTLREYNPPRLICLFGSVGGRSQARRAELGRVASEMADFCVITSDNPDFEPPNNIIHDIIKGFTRDCPFSAFADRQEAIRYAVRESRDGDIILFAGKGHETYQIIEGVYTPFSERNIIIDECDKIQESVKF